MANRTDPSAQSVRGTNPQHLIEKIVRMKIYEHIYWKEQCFGLNGTFTVASGSAYRSHISAESLIDKAVEIDHVGGLATAHHKPTKFLCLVLKMLQIQPEKEIVAEFILNEDFKYSTN